MEYGNKREQEGNKIIVVQRLKIAYPWDKSDIETLSQKHALIIKERPEQVHVYNTMSKFLLGDPTNPYKKKYTVLVWVKPFNNLESQISSKDIMIKCLPCTLVLAISKYPSSDDWGTKINAVLHAEVDFCWPVSPHCSLQHITCIDWGLQFILAEPTNCQNDGYLCLTFYLSSEMGLDARIAHHDLPSHIPTYSYQNWFGHNPCRQP